MAALVLSVTVYSFASEFALSGVRNSESALFVVMARVVGIDVEGVTVASPTLLLLARVAGVAMLASAAAVVVTHVRLARGRRAA